MELRLDRLLARLRNEAETILAAIDTDPLLLRRTVGDLVLANATQTLYTPQQEHQLYAKGIVYQREPYRLVSLPLIKIYNVGEKDVTIADLARLADDLATRLCFLRKMDGTLVQVFRHDGKVHFTTRGMLEGARWNWDEADEDRKADFDYLAEARRMATARYPRLLTDAGLLEGRTLLFELIHPDARKVTNYGDMADLVFIGCFDHARHAYLGYDRIRQLGEAHGLHVVTAFQPPGNSLAEQVEHLLAQWRGTDEEGCVLCFEKHDEIVYRVKLKSPDYLQLMRLMAFCTYERTVEFLDARPHIQSWHELNKALQEQGSDKVPEEVLVYYRDHWERFQRYLGDLEQVRVWAIAECAGIEAKLGDRSHQEGSAHRKAFAAIAKNKPLPGLLFAAYDRRLDLARMRTILRNEEDVATALHTLGLR